MPLQAAAGLTDAVSSRLPAARERAAKKIIIRGHALHRGELLTVESTVFSRLRTQRDYTAFARELRGQFAIVIHEPGRAFAITDFGGSWPIYYRTDDRLAVSDDLAEIARPGDNRIAAAALFFYASERGVGMNPFCSGARGIPPAAVACFSGSGIETASYLDWTEFIHPSGLSLSRAEERFQEIATDYLVSTLRGRGPVCCLLSGGTDSVLIASLLKSTGIDVFALTADYPWKHYSEFEAASAAAKLAGIEHERLLIAEKQVRRAFAALNAPHNASPCCLQEARMHFILAEHARKLGASVLVTGDHADSLFLGFDRFFRMLPAESGEISRFSDSLTTEQKLKYFERPVGSPAEFDPVLRAFGYRREECLAWQAECRADDMDRMREFAALAPLDVMQQLAGQIWGGSSWRNGIHTAIAALGGSVDFVSPFYDLDMIRFALSLPFEMKFRNGETKALLRYVLRKRLGLSLGKRASPNPARIWRLAPRIAERNAMPPALRPVYDRLFVRNLLSAGKLWSTLDCIAALGLWLGRA